jgi:hypothetical protein
LQHGIVSLAPLFDALFGNDEYFTFAIGNSLAMNMTDSAGPEKSSFISLFPKLNRLHLGTRPGYKSPFHDWRRHLTGKDLEQKIRQREGKPELKII